MRSAGLAGALTGQAPGEDGVCLRFGLSLDHACRAYAEAVLARNQGNRSAASRELGIGRNRLARLLRSE